MEMIINDVMKKRKPSKGRQRIEMKKIEKKSYLQVTFSKRYQTLFKKAAELNALTGADVAVIVKSPGGKFLSYGSPSPDYVFDRYLSQIPKPDRKRNGEEEVADREKASESEPFWWEQDVSTLGLAELKKFKAASEELKNNVMTQASHKPINERFSKGVSSSGLAGDSPGDVDFSDFTALEDLLMGSSSSRLPDDSLGDVDFSDLEDFLMGPSSSGVTGDSLGDVDFSDLGDFLMGSSSLGVTDDSDLGDVDFSEFAALEDFVALDEFF